MSCKNVKRIKNANVSIKIAKNTEKNEKKSTWMHLGVEYFSWKKLVMRKWISHKEVCLNQAVNLKS